ncbi:hypothetical protein KF282_1190 [Lactococcus lactis subsp. lactis]|uniref:Uncharacterized protein n=1 Tax=Lactococcus lactis subsp. lactis TaxID=1360 RepID=A0A0V8CYD3_LACLL|nr:hypothetical protein LK337_0898 [Lactococcus lactis subsp. lactis]KSU06291.1 hypothetical protein KF282_1190 [Lactococcus lactis subsp. lactis]
MLINPNPNVRQTSINVSGDKAVFYETPTNILPKTTSNF